jgi:acyl-CoA thioester hydrolase
MPTFIARRQVKFSETDMAGIVHFANFYRWMEEAEHEYFRSIGLRIMEKQPDGTYIGWPRVSASCHFDAPAHYEDEIEIRIEVERVGFKSLTFAMEFWCDSVRLAHGRLKTACCICMPDGTLKSIEIPPSHRQQIVEWPKS